MGLEDVGDLAMHMILSKLGPTEVAAVACVGNRFRYWASEDYLWTRFCSQDLNLSSPLNPSGNPSPSFKAAYREWREVFAKYPWPVVVRAKRCWMNLKNWLVINFPEVLPTLREGASEDEIDKFEESMQIKLPLPARVLYRFCDGQDMNIGSCGSSNIMGVIGGYSIYQHYVNVFLLPLRQVIRVTKNVVSRIQFGGRCTHVVLAASWYSQKLFLLNCSRGQLYVGTKNLIPDGEMLSCVPERLIYSVHDPRCSEQQDAMLLWLEEHVRRLEDRIIEVRQEEKIKSICLFPEEPPLCSSAITHGVKVRTSAVFVPELCDHSVPAKKLCFAYSVRLSLSHDGCISNGTTYSSCQLYWRHWCMRHNNVLISETNGDGLVGKYPILTPGQEEFFYQSCTYLAYDRGSMGGYFTGVTGRLVDPSGPPFQTDVAEFPLEQPDYIF